MFTSASNMNTTDLQVLLDGQISAFKKSDWIGELLLGNITIDIENNTIYNSEKNDKLTMIDICQYLPGGQNHNNINPSITKLRFDASMFPPTEKDEDAFSSLNPTYISLRNELQRAAIGCGYSIVPKSGARFVCKCGRTYVNGTSRTGKDSFTTDLENENADPQVSLRNKTWKFDSKNSRKKGPVPLCRNTSTSLPMEPGSTCKFSVKLYHDNKGYYISTRYGNAVHSNHPSIAATNNCFGLKLLPENVQCELEKLAKAKLGAAHGRNYIFANETDIFISKSQIRYAFRHADASSLGVALPDLKMGSDGLVQYFNSRKDIYYCIWGGNNTNDKKKACNRCYLSKQPSF